MERLPLSEETGDAIVARVAYQIILRDYQDNAEQYDHPPDRLLYLAMDYRLAGILLIGEALQSAAIHCAAGGKISTWRTLHDPVRTGRIIRLSRARATRQR